MTNKIHVKIDSNKRLKDKVEKLEDKVERLKEQIEDKNEKNRKLNDEKKMMEFAVTKQEFLRRKLPTSLKTSLGVVEKSKWKIKPLKPISNHKSHLRKLNKSSDFIRVQRSG